jgi:hypothetical protein
MSSKLNFLLASVFGFDSSTSTVSVSTSASSSAGVPISKIPSGLLP